MTPLHYAAMNGDAPSVAVLIGNKAMVNLKDQRQFSALSYCVSGKHAYCQPANAEGHCACYIKCTALLKAGKLIFCMPSNEACRSQLCVSCVAAGATTYRTHSVVTHFQNSDAIKFAPPSVLQYPSPPFPSSSLLLLLSSDFCVLLVSTTMRYPASSPALWKS
jgi:hypothetical protein